jgi:hypothetical protein
MNIFVGNLSYKATESDVKRLFEGYGPVVSVLIVTRKEKKVPKSRGFGFVEMADMQQALVAIGALNGQEFMKRALDVSPARPKTEVKAVDEVKETSRPEPAVEAAPYPRPAYPKPGTYKGGRRSQSYLKRQGTVGMQQEAEPRPRSYGNPMRWHNKKAEGEFKPWRKPEGSKPWQKSAGAARPWKKAEGEAKPWRKPEGDVKPWRKPEAGSKPWKKSSGDAKPWQKSAGNPKPWSKRNARLQKSGFKARGKPRAKR